MRVKVASRINAVIWLSFFSSAVCAQPPKQPSTIEVILPGYKLPASGRWLGSSQNQSGVPLGGMGAGYLELRPDGKFHDAVLRNNWSKPGPPAGCGLTFSAGH